MQSFRADLHCHTRCSDGSMTPVEIVHHAKEVGLSALCITDHDTIAAYETAIPEAKQCGLILAVGVEFSSDLDGKSVHILGYDFILDHPQILTYCARHRERRTERNQKILAKLKRLNKPIDEEELFAIAQTVGRPHIAQLMLQKGYVKSYKEAFDIYLGDGKPAYDPGPSFPVLETIEVIRSAGGKAFVTHPHIIDDFRIIQKLLEMPFDGIECYYARSPIEKENRWLKIAKKKGWLISGGSDFHGAVKPHIPLGCSWVDEPTFRAIFSRLC